MKWMRIPLGLLQTNTYILTNDKNECILFDPGDEGEKLIEVLRKHQLTPLAILLTHAHFDHIGAIDDVRKVWNIPVYVHEKEQKWLGDPSLNGSGHFMNGKNVTVEEADEIIREEGSLTIGSFQFSLFETPGHSPGSISYYLEEANAVFSGDVLFKGSIGRTDLLGGNHEELLKSIHEKLLVLPEETIVLPGHGSETTIIEEMETNPFLNGFSLS
ncbi:MULTISPECIES: MBL fold metallo-hydrolase [Aeribacillus]|uniref:MBL fold metallo-hydrolase n=1 Tax=Aeribacillus TaxID=1055323 RepID=UPI002E246670|nr:MBL fold metallo-hydrolase [Aeribacillus composti]